jgi:hypothetical protein
MSSDQDAEDLELQQRRRGPTGEVRVLRIQGDVAIVREGPDDVIYSKRQVAERFPEIVAPGAKGRP